MTHHLTLLTDLYQLTMAQGYWKLGKHSDHAVFDLFFREHPFQGGYTIFCGLESVRQMVENFHFTKKDIAYLATLTGTQNLPLFSVDFLQALLELRLTVDIHAMEEGSVVFPKEPLLRVEGPLWECQLLETTLLNLINFPTLIATKAARICFAAENDLVIEFGLRRSQGPDGGLTASRAAYVGGVASTSNILAGFEYGIPVAGTHAHSWVMAFENERSAFESYAKVMPHNCILLVDTYNTLEGVKNAIHIGLTLKAQGYSLLGIRLDSGDLAILSIAARKLLDDAGLFDTQIVGSNDLDEYEIVRLKKAGAKITLWGVGTRLSTAYEQPALGGVYKLVALKTCDGKWTYKAKQTDDIKKKSLPGIYGVKRIYKNNQMIRDIMYDVLDVPSNKNLMLESTETFEEMLKPFIRQGMAMAPSSTLHMIRNRVQSQLKKLPMNYRQLKPTLQYPVLIQEKNINENT